MTGKDETYSSVSLSLALQTSNQHVDHRSLFTVDSETRYIHIYMLDIFCK